MVFRFANSVLCLSAAASCVPMLTEAFTFQPTGVKNGVFGAHSAPSWSQRSIARPVPSSVSSSAIYMADSSTEQMSVDDVSAQLQEAKEKFNAELAEATTMSQAESIRVSYLGKKGVVNDAMKFMRLLSPEDKPKLGQVVNVIKEELEEKIAARKEELEFEEIEQRMEGERLDVTMPGLKTSRTVGKRHPLSMTMEKATDIFVKLGYDTVTDASDSPEIETDYYCFEALNCPKDHPARDMQDTFYLTSNLEELLRTHTSAVQIRQLGRRDPPLRIVAPGRVYRKDDIDATHSMVFHQVEILAIEEKGKLHLGHLKGTVDHFLREMFGPDIEVRYRGSYFPFTEPSMEVDVFFRGKWLEVLGCGMVDPNVLEEAGIDPTKYGGFAAGFGVERFAMVIHGITDIREFYKNDIRFLDQFPHFSDEGMYSFLRGKDYGNDRTFDIDSKFDPMEAGTEVKALQGKLEAELEKESAAVNGDDKKTKKQAAKKKKEGGDNNQAAAATEIDVSKLDIRVGVISKAWVHEEADKLFCEEIDIGEESGPRQIASGLRAHYNVEDLEGQRVLVLANLKTRKLAGFPSHGMVLCAATEDGSKVRFVEPPADAKLGERVMVAGYDGEPATENQIIKKKMLDAIFPDLKTNGAGVATYKGIPLSTPAGDCVAQDNMANVSVA
jgi:phenylalanyl-tRNA synthetase alpha chain